LCTRRSSHGLARWFHSSVLFGSWGWTELMRNHAFEAIMVQAFHPQKSSFPLHTGQTWFMQDAEIHVSETQHFDPYMQSNIISSRPRTTWKTTKHDMYELKLAPLVMHSTIILDEKPSCATNQPGWSVYGWKNVLYCTWHYTLCNWSLEKASVTSDGHDLKCSYNHNMTPGQFIETSFFLN
jgi:hypothetical protein